MASTPLASQTPTAAGLAPTYSAANVDGHTFYNTEKTLLIVKNGAGSPITVTFVTPGTADGNAIADPARTVPANGERHFGRIPDGTYNDSSDTVTITFSSVTSVTVALIEP